MKRHSSPSTGDRRCEGETGKRKQNETERKEKDMEQCMKWRVSQRMRSSEELISRATSIILQRLKEGRVIWRSALGEEEKDGWKFRERVG
ncbi:hypothetical protein CRENBAI_011380 [Crenichthys baileyi]|uniref:Uncharacterized protein n=1 Tax=Crenichthys baileyi TaxID=28760 RepID=A0AAV9RFL8_9TELE